MRVGVVARKLGMSRVYTAIGAQVPVTLLKVEDTVVYGVNDFAPNGGELNLQVASVRKDKNVAKPQLGKLRKNGIAGRRQFDEFRVSRNAELPVGQEVKANHFVVGQYVDVAGTSKGKGFAGVMKRHNFRGLEATHGVSISHRSHGSTGQRQDPGKVFKGKKMAGHLGNERCKIQNLEIMFVDQEENIIGVCGAVPGHKQSLVYVQDAIKKTLPAGAPYPCVQNEVQGGDNDDTEAQSASAEG